ncbi:hypothetical protein CFOL_v3_21678 [Cephalotus follicularis]|uniref:Uncharacterized protein n=1 Tax=Cephalotus follicularis TaxID=3775 RepID=A0A1Q3CDB4_CEPFO|nr:hypothetical protein CFOL_v3_21678 [Cephalotus follicularis]
MVAFIFNFIFSVVTTLANIITRLIFTTTAYLIVLLIHAFKVPGEALQTGMEYVGEVIRACFDYVFELAWEAISTLISTAFDNFVEAVTGSVSVTGSVFGDLVEKTRASLDGLLEDLPEIIGGLSEMIMTIVSDLWNNYKDALGYVAENIA